ncbi:MAG: ArnT family glycosyltransferase [Neisseriaceae bacterium]
MNKSYKLFFYAVILVNVIFNARYQLHYDEAYYWVFSQNLSMSYFDHPPMLAYMIKFFSLFGHSEFLVRCAALFSTIITVLMIYNLAKRMWGYDVANIALILALSSPLIEAMFFIITPDSPLLMFWAFSLYFFYKGVFEGSTKNIYMTGIFTGLGLLTKYTMVLIFPSLFLFLIFSNKYRRLLFQKDIYFSTLIAIIIFSPVIFWNYQHDWVSFAFQFHHGVDLSQKFNIRAFLDYMGGQLLIGGVFIFLALLCFVICFIKSNIKDDKLAFLLWPFVFILVFFGSRALFQHMEANWPAVAYISGIVLLAYWINKTKMRWIYIASFYLMLLIIVLVKLPLNLLPKELHNRSEVQIVNAFYGSKELLSGVRAYLRPEDIVLACDYGNASRAWFYLNLSRTHVLSDFKFAHMYQYWNNDLPNPIKNAIYICDHQDSEAMNVLKEKFKIIQPLDVMKYDNRIGERDMYIYRVAN